MEAEVLTKKATADIGSRAPVAFPNTSYYLPTILGMTGIAVEKIGDLEAVLEATRRKPRATAAGKRPVAAGTRARDLGMSMLFAAEAIEALRFAGEMQPESAMALSRGPVAPAIAPESEARGGSYLNAPIDDVQARKWGILLAKGRIPGVALLLGRAKSKQVASRIIRELLDLNILVLLGGNEGGTSIIDQAQEAGVELGYRTRAVALGNDILSAVHTFGFAARCAMMLGGIKPGKPREILRYIRDRVPGFVLALGELDDLACAVAAASSNFGFRFIADAEIPRGVNRASANQGWTAAPFASLPGDDDEEKAAALVQCCLKASRLKVRAFHIDIPVQYGAAFDGELVSPDDLWVEFGGQGSQAFEFLHTARLDEIEDGKTVVVGPDLHQMMPRLRTDLGIEIRVAGKKMRDDFEPFLERQVHEFLSGASGLQHRGSRDRLWLRVSKGAVDKGLTLGSIGKIVAARLRDDFGTVVEKVQVTVITDPGAVADRLKQARAAYAARDLRLAELTDAKVDRFYSCAMCRSFAPNQVCMVTPERTSPCGTHTWLDCHASFTINPKGPHQPVKLGKLIDAKKGIWEGSNRFVKKGSLGAVSRASMYSIMDHPMLGCASFQCIVMLIPEANGVMVVSQEDTSMTPAGLTFSAMAGMTVAGQQTPGVMGIGKAHLLSRKFISADGGFKRVVWMSSVLKESMSHELRVVAQREGDPDLIDKIADGSQVTSVNQLLTWLKAHNHPALTMEPMF
jgi:acetyl-CoA synthase